MKNTNLSRRRFLKGLAAAGVAIPAMNLLSASRSLGSVPKSVICVIS